MTYTDSIINDYFEWMSDIVCGKRYSKHISFRKLLMHLHNTEFRYSIAKDRNRASDGAGLRYRFALMRGYIDEPECLDGPCSVLEMIIALAIRCEESIMDDTSYGDRTGQWFWGMIANLGLGSMTDDRFDREIVDDILDTFMDRKYDRDGKGGLFTIRDCEYDMRKLEIWSQLNYYLNTVL